MALVSLLVLLSLRLTPILAQFTVVDLTFDLGEFTPVFPGDPPFNFTILFRGKTGGGGWYELNYFGTTEHAGTHVDAPAHFSKGSWRVHEIPASNLVGPAVVIDVSQKATDNPDYQLSVEDVQAWETTYGRIPHGAVVLVNSGRDSLYPDASLVFGTPTPENVSTFHFPGISPEAATFLTKKRDVIAVGVDTPSTDYGQTETFETHQILGKSNVLGLEYVRNMGQLPPRGATVVIGLIKNWDGSGAPARILAIMHDDAEE